MVAAVIHKNEAGVISDHDLTEEPFGATMSVEVSPWNILDKIISDVHPTQTPSSKAQKEVDSYLNDEILPRLNEC